MDRQGGGGKGREAPRQAGWGEEDGVVSYMDYYYFSKKFVLDGRGSPVPFRTSRREKDHSPLGLFPSFLKRRGFYYVYPGGGGRGVS